MCFTSDVQNVFHHHLFFRSSQVICPLTIRYYLEKSHLRFAGASGLLSS